MPEGSGNAGSSLVGQRSVSPTKKKEINVAGATWINFHISWERMLAFMQNGYQESVRALICVSNFPTT
jgi:hypothetical protein